MVVSQKKSLLSCGQPKKILFILSLNEKNPFCLVDDEKIFFEEAEKGRKKGGVQFPSRLWVKLKKKDFLSEKCPKQPEKAKKHVKKERLLTLLFRMSEW